MDMSRPYTYLGSLTPHLTCRWCQDLTLTMGALHFIWSADDDVKTSHLLWTPCTSSDPQMMMSRPCIYLRSLELHLICRWWCHDLTLILEALHLIWPVDDVKTSHLPWEPYTSSDLQMMMSSPYTYLDSLTLHLICRLWCQDITITLEALHYIWSVGDDAKTLHLSCDIFFPLICRLWWP